MVICDSLGKLGPFDKDMETLSDLMKIAVDFAKHG